MKILISVRGIIICEKKVLIAKLKEHHDFWCLPGGRMEPNESLEETIERELVEETGVRPKIGKLLFIHQWLKTEEPQLEFFFHIKNSRDYISFDKEKASHAHEIAEFKFLAPDDHSYKILPAFLKTEVKRFIEIGVDNFEVISLVD